MWINARMIHCIMMHTKLVKRLIGLALGFSICGVSHSQCRYEQVSVFGDLRLVCDTIGSSSNTTNELLMEQRRTNRLLEEIKTQNELINPTPQRIDPNELRRALEDIKTMNERLPILGR